MTSPDRSVNTLTVRSETLPRTLDPAKARADILKSASTCFAAKGYSGTSMSEIAEAAGVSKALILYHFSTKEALWHAVLAHHTATFVEATTQFIAPESKARVSDIVKTKFETNRSDPDLPRLMAWMSLEPSLLSPDIRERAQAVREQIQSAASQRGVPEGFDANAFMCVVMSAIDGFYRFRGLYSAMFGCDWNDPSAEDQFISTLLQLAFPQENPHGISTS